MNYPEYFNYLRSRSRLALIYRRLFLYPLLCIYLKDRALDIGCGIGDMLQFRKNTIGVDINPNNIAWCQKKGLNAILIDHEKLPFQNGYFSSALMDNVLEHITDPMVLLSEVHRVLKDRGRLVVGVPGRLGFKIDQDHKVFYDEATLIHKLSLTRFSLIKLLHVPFRSSWLDKKLPQYCRYGIFQKI